MVKKPSDPLRSWIIALVGFSLLLSACLELEESMIQLDDYQPQPRPAYYGFSVIQTADGGFGVCGYQTQRIIRDTDCMMLKTDRLGRQKWLRTYDGSGDNRAFALDQTTPDGYIMCGWISPSEDRYDVYLIKADQQGKKEWTRTFKGPESASGRAVQQTADGGYIVCGSWSNYYYGATDILVIKTDSHGNEEWTRTYAGEDHGYGKDVQQTNDGGFIICGTIHYYQESQAIYLLKIDSQGEKLWSQTFSHGYHPEAEAVQQTSDGGYIIVGSMLLKTDVSGTLEWDNKNVSGASIRQSPEGGYIICGTIEHNRNKDMVLTKTDGRGNKEWEKVFGTQTDDYGLSVDLTSDGGFILGGYSQDTSVYLVKTDQAGDEQWTSVLPE